MSSAKMPPRPASRKRSSQATPLRLIRPQCGLEGVRQGDGGNAARLQEFRHAAQVFHALENKAFPIFESGSKAASARENRRRPVFVTAAPPSARSCRASMTGRKAVRRHGEKTPVIEWEIDVLAFLGHGPDGVGSKALPSDQRSQKRRQIETPAIDLDTDAEFKPVDAGALKNLGVKSAGRMRQLVGKRVLSI